jgi:hypothetical protein
MSDKSSKSTKNGLKTIGKLSESGIEPDDMMGPVGCIPRRVNIRYLRLANKQTLGKLWN